MVLQSRTDIFLVGGSGAFSWGVQVWVATSLHLGRVRELSDCSIDGLAQSLKAMPSHEEKPATIRPTPRLDTQKPLLNHIKPSKSSI